MNRLLKGSLALGVTELAAGGLKRVMNSEPRYASWEKPDFEDFEHRVLILGGGFGFGPPPRARGSSCAKARKQR